MWELKIFLTRRSYQNINYILKINKIFLPYQKSFTFTRIKSTKFFKVSLQNIRRNFSPSNQNNSTEYN